MDRCSDIQMKWSERYMHTCMYRESEPGDFECTHVYHFCPAVKILYVFPYPQTKRACRHLLQGRHADLNSKAYDYIWEIWVFSREFLGGPPTHSPSLIPALFISSLMTVWPLFLAKGVTNPSGHWHRLQSQLQREGEKWKGWIWLLVLLFMSTLSHKV